MKGCCDSSTLSVGVESLPIVYSTGYIRILVHRWLFSLPIYQAFT
nr:MAG TPA: hypothetical protein [Caudoviricetes sp.]